MAYMEFPENVTYNDLWSDVIKVDDYYHCENNLIKYLDLIINKEFLILNSRDYGVDNDYIMYYLYNLNSEVERIIYPVRESEFSQLKIPFDELSCEQMTLFNDQYIAISDQDYSSYEYEAKNRLASDVASVRKWSNNLKTQLNGIIYKVIIEKSEDIKNNIIKQLWLFYTFVITDFERCFNWRSVGYTYITYITTKERVPVKDYAFWNWVEVLLK